MSDDQVADRRARRADKIRCTMRDAFQQRSDAAPACLWRHGDAFFDVKRRNKCIKAVEVFSGGKGQ